MAEVSIIHNLTTDKFEYWRDGELQGSYSGYSACKESIPKKDRWENFHHGVSGEKDRISIAETGENIVVERVVLSLDDQSV